MSEPVGGDRPNGARRGWRGWARLAGGLLAIWLFIFVVAPWLQGWEPIRSLHEHSRRADIDATALFYTESDAVGPAEAYMNDVRRFSGRRPF